MGPNILGIVCDQDPDLLQEIGEFGIEDIDADTDTDPE